MTERKPPGMKTQDWVEAQIKRAQNAGGFNRCDWPTGTTRTGG
jgi:hypothetical protein